MTSNQTNFSPAKFREIDVPCFSVKLQTSIALLFQRAYQAKVESKTLYASAEELLLSALGLAAGFTPQGCVHQSGTSAAANNSNVKSFSESFDKTGRLDAEYYLPKYERIIELIQRQKHERLGNIVNIKKSIEPGSDVYSDSGTPFIRVADFNQVGISTNDKFLNETFCKNNAVLIESLYPKKDTILFSKDGSIGTALMLREDIQAVTSGAILHLTVKNKQTVLPNYLTLVLNSEVVKLQAERDAGGSIILHWRLEEIENVLVPILPLDVQRRIASLLDKSFRLRQESVELLELAKQAVEIAIEQGEKKALRILESASGKPD